MTSSESGWVTAKPLLNYSSLHQFSLTRWLGLGKLWPKKRTMIQFDFNLVSPFCPDSQADVIIKTVDADKPADSNSCFSISNLTRWRLPIDSYNTFDDFEKLLIRWHRCNYRKSKKIFTDCGCTVSLIESDWTKYVDEVYTLYQKVARLHDDRLYDIQYFRELAKNKSSKLLCAWHEGRIIAVFFLQEEPSILHCTCCGMDYDYSSKSHAYSWLSFELIRLAIESHKYNYLDVGLTANDAKQAVGFQPIAVRMDVYSKNRAIECVLKFLSSFISATITSNAKLRLRFKST